MPGLGRIVAPDDRDRDHLIRPMLSVVPSEEEPLRTSRYWFSNGWWGDQGDRPHCVGYGWAHWLEDGPFTHPGQSPIVDPVELYRRAQLIDEWPGENYDGTSVRAGAKVLQSLGYVGEYRWAFDVWTVVRTLLELGPVVLGVNWYGGMFTPNEDGLIRPTGRLAGGHCVVANGANVRRGIVRIKNSWGRDWGKNGNCWMSFDDLDRLIREDGEACLAVEKRKEAS